MAEEMPRDRQAHAAQTDHPDPRNGAIAHRFFPAVTRVSRATGASPIKYVPIIRTGESAENDDARNRTIEPILTMLDLRERSVAREFQLRGCAPIH
jgi:hypothetical protein